jgi:hypothetical protein
VSSNEKVSSWDGPASRPEILRAFDGMHALLDAHADAALFTLTDDDVLELLETRETLTRRLDALDLRAVRELDGRNIAQQAGATNTADLLRGHLLTRPAAAHTRVRMAAALDRHLTATRQALTDGAISLDHAQVIRTVVSHIHPSLPTTVTTEVEQALLRVAVTLDPGHLEKVGRALLITINPAKNGDDTRRTKRSLRIWEREDGMTHLAATLDPDSAATVTAALDALSTPRPGPDGQPDPRTPPQRRADSLVEICEHAMNTGTMPTTGTVRPHVSVIVPWETLTGTKTAPAYTTLGTIPLPPDTIDRITCDAAIRRIVLGPHSEPLDVGRAQRTPSAALRAAVTARDICCTAPGCDRPAGWCVTHHITHWNNNGPTSLDNLALACGHHHRLAHHAGWKVRLGPHHRIQWQAPPWQDPHQTWRTNPIRTARDPYAHHHTGPAP